MTARPGKTEPQGAVIRYVWDSESIRPSEASGGWTPMPRKQPKVHVEVVGSWQDRPAYERFQHWKPHIENMYHMLGYGDVTVEPSQKMVDEYNAIQANKEKGA